MLKHTGDTVQTSVLNINIYLLLKTRQVLFIPHLFTCWISRCEKVAVDSTQVTKNRIHNLKSEIFPIFKNKARGLKKLSHTVGVFTRFYTC